jgi:hypothetical protein
VGRGKRRREAKEWEEARKRSTEDRLRILAEARRAQDASLEAKGKLYGMAGPVRMDAGSWQEVGGLTSHNTTVQGAYFYTEERQAEWKAGVKQVKDELTSLVGIIKSGTLKVTWDPSGHFVLTEVVPDVPTIDVPPPKPSTLRLRAGKRNLAP